MELKDIAAIAGKPGLYRVVKPTYNGLIVETLDEKKRKMSVSAAHRVSILKEVSIYTNDQEGSMPLGDILLRIHQEYAGELPVNAKSGKDELQDFMASIVPEYDQERVYPSDIKKLMSWYNILVFQFPDTLEEILQDTEAEENPETEETPEEKVEETPAPPKETATKAKKTSKKAEPEVSAKETPAPKDDTAASEEEKPAPKKTSRKKTSKASPKAEKAEDTQTDENKDGLLGEEAKTESKPKAKTTRTRKKKTAASAEASSEEVKTEQKPKTTKKTSKAKSKKETDA